MQWLYHACWSKYFQFGCSLLVLFLSGTSKCFVCCLNSSVSDVRYQKFGKPCDDVVVHFSVSWQMRGSHYIFMHTRLDLRVCYYVKEWDIGHNMFGFFHQKDNYRGGKHPPYILGVSQWLYSVFHQEWYYHNIVFKPCSSWWKWTFILNYGSLRTTLIFILSVCSKKAFKDSSDIVIILSSVGLDWLS